MGQPNTIGNGLGNVSMGKNIQEMEVCGLMRLPPVLFEPPEHHCGYPAPGRMFENQLWPLVALLQDRLQLTDVLQRFPWDAPFI